MDLPLLKSLAARGPVGLDVQGFARVCENGQTNNIPGNPLAGVLLDLENRMTLRFTKLLTVKEKCDMICQATASCPYDN